MIELYVHSQNGGDPKLVKASEESTITEFIQAAIAADCLDGKADGEILVFIEEQDEPLGQGQTLAECEVRHKHHIHVHRCKRVKVGVFYNSERHELFAPSAKVKNVLKWAIKAFTLTPAEAADKILVLKGNPDSELSPDAHIGSYAKPNQCAVELCLVAPVEIHG